MFSGLCLACSMYGGVMCIFSYQHKALFWTACMLRCVFEMVCSGTMVLMTVLKSFSLFVLCIVRIGGLASLAFACVLRCIMCGVVPHWLKILPSLTPPLILILNLFHIPS